MGAGKNGGEMAIEGGACLCVENVSVCVGVDAGLICIPQ